MQRIVERVYELLQQQHIDVMHIVQYCIINTCIVLAVPLTPIYVGWMVSRNPCSCSQIEQDT